MKTRVSCLACDGTGWKTCLSCMGSGRRITVSAFRRSDEEDDTCAACHGQGRVKCKACHGRGYKESAGRASWNTRGGGIGSFEPKQDAFDETKFEPGSSFRHQRIDFGEPVFKKVDVDFGRTSKIDIGHIDPPLIKIDPIKMDPIETRFEPVIKPGLFGERGDIFSQRSPTASRSDAQYSGEPLSPFAQAMIVGGVGLVLLLMLVFGVGRTLVAGEGFFVFAGFACLRFTNVLQHRQSPRIHYVLEIFAIGFGIFSGLMAGYLLLTTPEGAAITEWVTSQTLRAVGSILGSVTALSLIEIVWRAVMALLNELRRG